MFLMYMYVLGGSDPNPNHNANPNINHNVNLNSVKVDNTAWDSYDLLGQDSSTPGQLMMES